jgi:putative protein kinase ArgK-like GTPase of G3E family
VDGLLAAIDAHRSHLRTTGEMAHRDRARIVAELDRLLRDALVERLLGGVDADRLADLVDRIVSHELLPQAAVDMLIAGE